MPDIPDKPSYTHGSTGTAPATSVDYTNGDPYDADNADYFINTPFEKVKDIIDYLEALDSDEDGVVDAADTAASADTASTYKGNDIDTDGDGKVDAADVADSADTAGLYKNNDIDSDGDGVVDAADSVETGGTAAVIEDTTNNQNLLVANEGGPVNVPVTLQYGGNEVATQTWVNSNFSTYTDSDAINAINNDADHGSTASHNYYSDSEAVDAVDGSSLQSLDIGSATVTNSTFIQSERGSNSASTSSGTWVAIADTEQEDNLSEQDSSFNINVDESGWYEVFATAQIGCSDGDTIQCAIRDVDAGSSLFRNSQVVGGGVSQDVGLAATVNLSAGTNYQVQGRNGSSSFKIFTNTRYVVKRSVVEV